MRRNTLKIILSRETKNIRGVAHIASGEKVDNIKVELNVDELMRKLSRMEGAVRKHRQMFSAQPFLGVTYEEFVSDPADCTERIFSFLGVDSAVNLEMPLKKINPDSLEQLIANYTEVRARLLDSPYAYLLDS